MEHAREGIRMTTTMIDSIHSTAHNIPPGTLKVAGYVTGTPDVKWTDADWQRFPNAGRVRIDQGYPTFLPLSCDVFDVEPKALSPVQAAEGVAVRIAHGIKWTTIYASDFYLSKVQQALSSTIIFPGKPIGWWHGHVNCWLADWNLDEHGAAAKLGTLIHGMTCVAVQWASPTSNPDTPLPGNPSLTLKQANCDLSVTADDWYPPPNFKPVVISSGYLIPATGNGQPKFASAKMVHSSDGGHTWA